MEKELAPREELSDYEYKLRRVRAVQRGREEEKEANKTSLNEIRVPDAHYCAEQNIEMLLRLLHQALKNAFLMNYLRRKGAVEQMKCIVYRMEAVVASNVKTLRRSGRGSGKRQRMRSGRPLVPGRCWLWMRARVTRVSDIISAAVPVGLSVPSAAPRLFPAKANTAAAVGEYKFRSTMHRAIELSSALSESQFS